MSDKKFRQAAAAGAVVVFVAAVILADLETARLFILAVQALILIGTAAAAVYAVGLVHHRLLLLAEQRLPQPAAPLVVNAYTPPVNGGVLTTANGAPMDPPPAQGDGQPVDHAGEVARLDRQGLEPWPLTLTRYALAGNVQGFSWPRLCPFVGRYTWQECNRALISMGVLMPARGQRAPQWAAGWSYSRLRASIKHGLIDLPAAPHPLPVVPWPAKKTHGLSSYSKQS